MSDDKTTAAVTGTAALAASPVVANVPISVRVTQYVAVRNVIRALEKKHKAELKEPREIRDALAGLILNHLNSTNLQRISGDGGTAYKSQRSSASVQDADAFINFIKNTGEWDLIERRANATKVREYIKEHHLEPPGVKLSTTQTLGVLGPDGKKFADDD